MYTLLTVVLFLLGTGKNNTIHTTLDVYMIVLM